MEPFDFKKSFAGEKVCTGAGEPVYLAHYNCKVMKQFPLLGLVTMKNGVERIEFYRVDGFPARTPPGFFTTDQNLYMAPSKYTGWINIYSSDAINLAAATAGGVFKTKSGAEESDPQNERVACIQIEWER